MRTSNPTLLAGEIGATTTTLAVVDPTTAQLAIIASATYPNARYPSLAALVQAFLADSRHAVEQAVFSISARRATPSPHGLNTLWPLDLPQLRAALNLSSVRLLPLSQALAYAAPRLEAHNLRVLRPGRIVAHGPRLVIALDRELETAFLLWDGQRYRACPSAGPFTAFAPTNLVEIEILHYLHDHVGQATYAQVCSTYGVHHLYAYLKDIGYAAEPEWVHTRLARTRHPLDVLVAAARQGQPRCSLCLGALEHVVTTLGAYTAQVALTVLATGGIYLGGHLAEQLAWLLDQECFQEGFPTTGPAATLLRTMPIYLITRPHAALLGLVATFYPSYHS